MFLTLKEYLLGARKLLALYGYNCLKNDEDAISYVASCMMNADRTWDGTKSSRDTWRFNQAKFAIMKLKTAHRKKRKLRSLEDNLGSGNSPHPIFLKDVIEQPSADFHTPMTVFANIMKYAELVLSQQQLTCLKMRYQDDLKLEDIGTQLGISKQAVDQHIKKAIKTLKNECQLKFDSFAP